MIRHNTLRRIVCAVSAVAVSASIGLSSNTPVVAQRAPMTLAVQTSGYETWGRPEGMDNPKASCGNFDDSHPVSKFNVSLSIKNTSSRSLSKLELMVQKTTGKLAYVCYYGYAKGLPAIAPGQTVNITFAAFMERTETATRISLSTSQGTSASLLFDVAGKPVGTSTAGVSAPAITGRIGVSLQNSGYEQWGRPAGMDNTKAGCDSFDDSRPVRKFNVSLAVTNNTNSDMVDWTARLFKSNGREAYVCYNGYDKGLPKIVPGQTVNVTFSAFMEVNESPARLWIQDKTIGRSGVLAVR